MEIRPEGLPYIETDFRIPVGNGIDPIEFDMELRRTPLAKGKLLDKKSGEPIVNAKMFYAPYTSNEHCSKYIRYADDTTTMLGNESRYLTDENGEFEIPVIPGRGVIGAKATEGSYITSYGAQKIEALKDKQNAFRILSDHLVPSLYHSLLEINVSETSQTHEVAMEVDQGISMVVRFVDPKNKPLAGVSGGGLTSDRKWRRIKDDHATATGLEIGSIRSTHFSHQDRNLSRMTRIVPQEGQTETTIQLLPLGQMTGRIIDRQGRPIANAVIQASHQNDPDFSASLQQVRTNKDGEFEYELPVGVKYNIQVQVEGNIRTMDQVDLTEKPMRIDVGELEYDEHDKRWTKLKSKRAPKMTNIVATNKK